MVCKPEVCKPLWLSEVGLQARFTSPLQALPLLHPPQLHPSIGKSINLKSLPRLIETFGVVAQL